MVERNRKRTQLTENEIEDDLKNRKRENVKIEKFNIPQIIEAILFRGKKLKLLLPNLEKCLKNTSTYLRDHQKSMKSGQLFSAGQSLRTRTSLKTTQVRISQLLTPHPQ